MEHLIERIFTSSYWYHALLSLIVPAVFIFLAIYIHCLRDDYQETKRSYYRHSSDRDAIEKKIRTATICLTIVAVIGIGSVAGLFVWRHIRLMSTTAVDDKATVVASDIELYSLSNGVSVDGHGSFSLLGGSFVISSSDTYRYYYKEGNRYRQGSVPANKTYIEYITDENTKPHVVGYKTWDRCVITYNGEERIWDYDSSTTKTYYVLYVPEGSIVESFALN